MTRAERKELNYLKKKEKVCPLDKYEQYRLYVLLRKEQES